MHQILSYEEALQASSSRDPREYVTKRTCLVLVFTVAFCAVILGFFLGKLISDHQQNRRHLVDAGEDAAASSGDSVVLSSADYRGLKQLRSYQHSKELLLAAARQLGQQLRQDNKGNYLPSSLNSDIFNKYVSCTQDIPPNTSVESSRFIEELINNTAARQRDCMRVIQMIIDNNLASG